METFYVLLEDAGKDRVAVMRALRAHRRNPISLIDAKRLASLPNVIVARDLAEDDARVFCSELRKAGARATFAVRDSLRFAIKDATQLPAPTESACLEALDAGAAQTREQEIALRRAWWIGNAEYRLRDKPFLSYTMRPERVRVNVERLVELIESDDPDDRLNKAEAARQLGHFDEAIKVLIEAPFPISRQSAAGQLLTLAQLRSIKLDILS